MKDFSRYGSVECTGDTVIRFNEKKFCKDGLINGGIYIINREFFGSLYLPEVFSIETDVLEKHAGSSLLKCMVFNEPFIDIGIPEDYKRAGMFLMKE
jgi:D-glycero-alpha-D-manno-heptose 1-phosphate guanylyltransferase